ncbi:hypothetical protein MNB_SV-15-683 [hydrothermal vent metagenome]|uniref:Uncharacterized protein n=1 Tax=hydrothermal vent metagenome TaxID=652676 RepID=A0A1W1EHS8_9ZZZZ
MSLSISNGKSRFKIDRRVNINSIEYKLFLIIFYPFKLNYINDNKNWS